MTRVQFNGVNTTFTLNSSNQLTASVPAGAGTGPISVVAAGGLATSATPFTLTASALPPSVTLTVARVGPDLVLSWPSAASTYTLQQNPNLDPAHWASHSGPVADNGLTKSVTLESPAGTLFFRLVAPTP